MAADKTNKLHPPENLPSTVWWDAPSPSNTGGKRTNQISPSFPPQEDLASSTHTILVQQFKYGSLWVRVRSVTDSTPNELKEVLNFLEEKKAGPVYVSMSEDSLQSFPSVLAVVRARQYKHHHFHNETQEIVYYRWFGEGEDKVPSYATAIEGGGAIILSPDMDEVLLMRDIRFPFFGRCGGAVPAGETCLETAKRETVEEVNVQLDESFSPLLAVLVNTPHARDALVNDHFHLYILKSNSKDFKIDPVEVADARWFKIDDVVDKWERKGGKEEAQKNGPYAPIEIYDGVKIGGMEVRGIIAYHEKRAIPVTVSKGMTWMY